MQAEKSALIIRFVQGSFVEKYDPSIDDSYRKVIDIDNKSYMLDIFDTAGAEQFSAMRDLYIKNSRGFVLAYNITVQSSFNDVEYIRNQILRIKGVESVPMVLVGNRCDLEADRVVSYEQGEALAATFNCPFLEASVRTHQNVSEIFETVARQVIASTPQLQPQAHANDKRSEGCVVM